MIPSKQPAKKFAKKKNANLCSENESGCKKGTCKNKKTCKICCPVMRFVVSLFQCKKNSCSSKESCGKKRCCKCRGLFLLFLLSFAVGLVVFGFGGGKFNSKKDFVVVRGQTWIRTDDKVVKLSVLTSDKCTDNCDISNILPLLRNNISQALVIEEIEAKSKQGQKLIQKFDLQSVPSFIFSDDLEKVEKNGANLLEISKEIFVKKGQQYLLEGNKIGLPVGMFLQDLVFDEADEPVRGDGELLIVEFTDTQCPFCATLHKNISSSVKKFVKEGKIKFMTKDFPLAFHKEALKMHKALNCTAKLSGNNSYYNLQNKIFSNQTEWSQKTGQESEFLTKYFADLELDSKAILECMKDPDVDKEIKEDQAEGIKYGVSGTPALFIGNKLVSGAISAETFESAVNAALGE